ncbi:MAG TPA: rod shape-determining protein MreC [Candidatus Dojkabacteria bacterium]|nr:rod shape-determining protein MreC [Candidatus Dojkabacteria bacterium]
MKESKQYSKSFSLLIILLSSVILMLVSNLLIGDGIRNLVSYVYTPVSFGADNLGKSLANYFDAFKNISQLKSENEDLKAQVAQLKSLQAKQILTEEESSQLKLLLKSQNINVKYIESQVMSYEGLSGMIINKGESNGIKDGQSVITDNLFLGLVSGVDRYSSKIRTIYDKASTIKVMIVSKKESNNIKDVVKKHSFVNAAMIGNTDTIKIENIAISKGVKNGDIVVTNDDRIGQYIIIGEIDGLTTDKAVSTLSAFVKPYEEFNQLKFVFVLTND